MFLEKIFGAMHDLSIFCSTPSPYNNTYLPKHGDIKTYSTNIPRAIIISDSNPCYRNVNVSCFRSTDVTPMAQRFIRTRMNKLLR